MQAMKRFYKQALTDADAAGWVVKLDSRTLRSPAAAGERKVRLSSLTTQPAASASVKACL